MAEFEKFRKDMSEIGVDLTPDEAKDLLTECAQGAMCGYMRPLIERIKVEIQQSYYDEQDSMIQAPNEG